MDELLLPAPELRPYIEGYWGRSGFYDPPKKVRVVADACTKLIFEIEPMPWPSCYLIGTQLAPIVVELVGKVDRVGIRFRPGLAGFFFGLSLDGLASGAVAAARLPIAEGEDMLRRLADAASAPERAAVLDRWLLSCWSKRRPDPGEVGETIELGRQLRLGRSPSGIARTTGWSERRLQRLCRRRFGAPASTLHRFYRFELLQARLRAPVPSLAGLAAELGYSDQPHMARDFRRFSGTTISAFVLERAAVGNVQDATGWLPVLRELEAAEA